jgi:hypothetical protein
MPSTPYLFCFSLTIKYPQLHLQQKYTTKCYIEVYCDFWAHAAWNLLSSSMQIKKFSEAQLKALTP